MRSLRASIKLIPACIPPPPSPLLVIDYNTPDILQTMTATAIVPRLRQKESALTNYYNGIPQKTIDLPNPPVMILKVDN